jgi:hypothetical protein
VIISKLGAIITDVMPFAMLGGEMTQLNLFQIDLIGGTDKFRGLGGANWIYEGK